MRYQIAWYDGFGGKPDYSKGTFASVEEARKAGEAACELYGDVAFAVVYADTHRRVKQEGA